MELNLVRDMKKEKRKAKEILVPLLNEGRHLVAHEIELMSFLRQSFRNLQNSDTRGKVSNKENFPW